MLSQAQRTTILELHTQGVAKREIARVLGISRVAVRQVLRSNSTAVPEKVVHTQALTTPAFECHRTDGSRPKQVGVMTSQTSGSLKSNRL